MDSYLSGLSLHKCDIAMVEPISYDEYYTQFADIYELIKDEIEERKQDPFDGEIYGELIRDLRADEIRDEGKTKIKVTTRALVSWLLLLISFINNFENITIINYKYFYLSL